MAANGPEKACAVPLPARDPDFYARLREAVRRGGGGDDFFQLEGESRTEKKDAGWQPWMEYELNVEAKHCRFTVPFVLRYTPLVGKTILDYGCGTGGLSVVLAAAGATVTGIEPSSGNHALAGLRAAMYGLERKTTFLHHRDTARLPFTDNSFDLVIANSVLEYVLKNRRAHIREMFRVVNKGGLLCITDTSNGLYPREIHSGRWFVNYLPRRAERLRCERGLSYREILTALKGLDFMVMNSSRSDEDLRWYYRREGRPLSGGRRALYTVFFLLRHTLCRPFSLPVAALFPWLNIVLLKK